MKHPSEGRLKIYLKYKDAGKYYNGLFFVEISRLLARMADVLKSKVEGGRGSRGIKKNNEIPTKISECLLNWSIKKKTIICVALLLRREYHSS